MTIFNEDSLRDEITKVWGEYGAHAEVFETLITHDRSTNKLLAEAVEIINGGVFPGKGKKRDAFLQKVAEFTANPFMEI